MVAVCVPIGRPQMELDIAPLGPSGADGHNGAAKIGPRPTRPVAAIDDGDRLMGGRPEGTPQGALSVPDGGESLLLERQGLAHGVQSPAFGDPARRLGHETRIENRVQQAHSEVSNRGAEWVWLREYSIWCRAAQLAN